MNAIEFLPIKELIIVSIKQIHVGVKWHFRPPKEKVTNPPMEVFFPLEQYYITKHTIMWDMYYY